MTGLWVSERYELLRPLGQGGGGEVWRAEDRATGKSVALKRLHESASGAEVEALLRETTTLAGLEGYGFPQVLAVERGADGRWVVVRELVEGQSLRQWSHEEPVRALQLLPALGDILTLVHRMGILHGDVKPENCVVRPDQSLVLVDWGFATALRSGGLPAWGMTPHYAAPEVRAGAPFTVQAEVYSLGVLLKDGIEAAERSLPPARRERLLAVAARALQTEPGARYPSADEWSSALRSAWEGEAVPRAEWMPWPIVAVEDWCQEFLRSTAQVPVGAQVAVLGPEGSGRTTFLRRLSCTLSLQGQRVVFLEEESALQLFLREGVQKIPPGAWVLVDSEWSVPAELAGSPVRWVLGLRPEQLAAREASVKQGGGDLRVFALPELSEQNVSELCQASLPELAPERIPWVREWGGSRPAELRRWVQAAQGRPLLTREDFVAVLSEERTPELPVELRLQKLLDRGHFKETEGEWEQLDRTQPEILWLYARYLVGLGRAAEALALLVARLPQEGGAPVSSLLEQRLCAIHARALLGVNQAEAALRLLEESESFLPEPRVEAAAYRGLAQLLLGQMQEARTTLIQAEQDALSLGQARLLALCVVSLATVQWRSGAFEEAESAYERALAAAQQAGDSGMMASIQINGAGLFKEQGDLARALAWLSAARETARRAGRSASVVQALLNLINIDLFLGRLERAAENMSELGAPEQLEPLVRAQYRGMQAELLARRGELAQAFVEYERCAREYAQLEREREASEAYLESLLLWEAWVDQPLALQQSVGMPSRAELQNRWELGQAWPGEELKPLRLLAEAVGAAAQRQWSSAEERALLAWEEAKRAKQKQWAWRAAAFAARALEQGGQETRAARLRVEALEILEEMATRLPPDLREVFWSESGRRALAERARQGGSAVPSRGFAGASPARPDQGISAARGADAISRVSQTPLERRLARILAINHELAGEIELSRLGEKIVAHAAELLQADRALLLLGTQVEELTVQASRGGEDPAQLSFSRFVAGQVLRAGVPFVSTDIESDPRLSTWQSVHVATLAAVACVPIRSASQGVVGVLYLETLWEAEPRLAAELPMLQAFADQAAIAWENARLLKKLEDQSAELRQQNEKLAEAQERLKEVLAVRTERLREVRQELRLTKRSLRSSHGFRGLVGNSAAMRRIYALIERVQETNVPVLITGESGTGKEVVARAIHEGSPRQGREMLAINCGAIPESLLESELMGHERGAFTGANRARRGLFLEAQGSTLFLDEIGETPLKMQASLLRVLQEQKVRPVGSSEELSIDVRMIFATNRDLEQAVLSQQFREDLYYRIFVVQIHLPPLRERQEDIPLLVDHFLSRFALRFQQEKKGLSRAALARLMSHPLPGNVRQLENILLNAWVLSDSAVIEEQDLVLTCPLPREPDSLIKSSSSSGAEQERSSSRSPALVSGVPDAAVRARLRPQQERERAEIVAALQKTQGNRVRAAALLAMPRRTFYRRLREYEIV